MKARCRNAENGPLWRNAVVRGCQPNRACMPAELFAKRPVQSPVVRLNATDQKGTQPAGRRVGWVRPQAQCTQRETPRELV